ncbi:MAG: hypothetical protein EON58_04615 [Alphaproteobacteria bacterium]|nr:MAG: hypothetical protein EON58_04615 [Alphaproteobacteria bacterium]
MIVSNDLIALHGYAFVPRLLPHLLLPALVDVIGTLATMESGSAYSTLEPMPEQHASPVSYSGMYGMGEFPFHTDLAHWRQPPRFLLLRCVTGFREVPTLLVDGHQLIERIGPGRLSRALVRPRRPRDGSIPLLRLYQRSDADSLLRWDSKFIAPSGRAGTEAYNEMQVAIAETTPIHIELQEPADTLIVDNWRMLHARGGIPEHCKGRRVERAYLGKIT